MTDVVHPHLCPDSPTPFHRWVSNWITGEVLYCWWCRVEAGDVDG